MKTEIVLKDVNMMKSINLPFNGDVIVIALLEVILVMKMIQYVKKMKGAQILKQIKKSVKKIQRMAIILIEMMEHINAVIIIANVVQGQGITIIIVVHNVDKI